MQFILETKVCRVSLEMYRVWKLCIVSSVMWTCQNDLDFNLYAVLSVCYMVATSND